MNLALAAFLLALLLLPGGFFRVGYLRGLFRRSAITGQNFQDNLGWLIVGALLTHSVLIWLVGALLHRQISYVLVLPVLAGQFGKDGVLLSNLIADLPRTQGYYAAYFVATFVLGYALGLLLHLLVRRTGLDQRVSILRLGSDWFYTLDPSAHRLAVGTRSNLFGRQVKVYLLPDVYVSGVVEQNDVAYLYRGIVLDYSLDEKGNLERVELELAHRRKLSDDRPDGGQPPQDPSGYDHSRYYDIAGDRFILRMSEVKTLNVQYVYVADSDDLEVVSGDPAGAEQTGAQEVPTSEVSGT